MRGCVVLVVALIGSQGRAAPDSIAAGLEAYEKLDYRRAVALLHQAFTESLDPASKITVLKTLAFAYVALDEDDQARAAFRLLLKVDPHTTLDETISPRVRLVFEEAGSEIQQPQVSPAPLALSATLDPPRPLAGQPLMIVAVIPGAASAQLFYRSPGQIGFQRVSALAPDGHVALTVPGSDVKPPGLEYYLQARDGREQLTAQVGTEDRWLRVDVTAPSPARRGADAPIYRHRWFWGAAAGVSVAIIFIGVVAGVVAHPTTAQVTIAHP
jgi:hypothetical protein